MLVTSIPTPPTSCRPPIVDLLPIILHPIHFNPYTFHCHFIVPHPPITISLSPVLSSLFHPPPPDPPLSTSILFSQKSTTLGSRRTPNHRPLLLNLCTSIIAWSPIVPVCWSCLSTPIYCPKLHPYTFRSLCHWHQHCPPTTSSLPRNTSLRTLILTPPTSMLSSHHQFIAPIHTLSMLLHQCCSSLIICCSHPPTTILLRHPPTTSSLPHALAFCHRTPTISLLLSAIVLHWCMVVIQNTYWYAITLNRHIFV